ncbi:MAG: DUF4410 domain-containing protein [Candidatus Binatia bacterium]
MRSPLASLSIALVAALTFAACSASSPPTEKAMDRGGPRIDTVSAVVVTVNPRLPSDKQTRFENAEGPSRLERSLEAKLSQTGRLRRDSPNVLEVDVTSYRMRSGAAVFWVGAMAGADALGVTVTIRDGSGIVRTFPTGAASIGAYAGLDQVSRLERLVEATALRILNDL